MGGSGEPESERKLEDSVRELASNFFQSSEDNEWQERAECRKPWVDPEWFFPGRGKSNDIEMAKFTCFVCKVSEQCNEYQARTGSIGIWAGELYSEGKVDS